MEIISSNFFLKKWKNHLTFNISGVIIKEKLRVAK